MRTRHSHWNFTQCSIEICFRIRQDQRLSVTWCACCMSYTTRPTSDFCWPGARAWWGWWWRCGRAPTRRWCRCCRPSACRPSRRATRTSRSAPARYVCKQRNTPGRRLIFAQFWLFQYHNKVTDFHNITTIFQYLNKVSLYTSDFWLLIDVIK